MHFLQRKLITIILVLVSFSVSFAQEIDGNKLLKHLEYLSSDELEGRKPLSKGSNLAQKKIHFTRANFLGLGGSTLSRFYPKIFF